MSQDANAGAAQIRILTPADLPGALRLSGEAKWNQTEQDWRNLLAFEPQGCFGAVLDGKLAGTATTTRFEPASGRGSFGWVGMVLVDPEARRHGLGSALLGKSIAYLQACGVETVRLDATPMGKKVYDKLGFTDEYELERWEGTARKVPGGVYGTWTLEQAAPAALEELAAYDAPLFGAHRRTVLAAWLRDDPAHALVLRHKGKLAGYALARAGANFHHIGPIAAEHPDGCEALLLELCARLAGRKVLLDLVSANAWTLPLARRCGLTHERPFIRMALGPRTAPGKPDRFLAICCPELG